MKTSVLIFVLITIFVSCNDDKNCNCSADIYGKWEVQEFMSVESVAYPKDNDYSPTIEFKNDGRFEVRLNINVCSGTFVFLQESGIIFSDIGCTDACCDSAFSEKFIEMLPQIENYSLKENELKLEVPGWGWISLELLSN